MLSLEKNGQALKAELCRILIKIGALKFGIFKLTSGRKSPYYIDLRIVPSFPDAFSKICDFYVSLIETGLGPNSFDRIAAVPTAGIPFASIIAYRMRKPFLYIRPRTRLHGRERRIEGLLMPGDHVLLIDDLVTTGVSLGKAAEAVRAEGGTVTDAVVLLDREESGKENLVGSNVALHYLLRMSEAAKILYAMDAIKEDQYNLILKQVKK